MKRQLGTSILLFLFLVTIFTLSSCGYGRGARSGSGSGAGNGFDEGFGGSGDNDNIFGSGSGNGTSWGAGQGGSQNSGPLGDVTRSFLSQEDLQRGNTFLNLPFMFKFDGPRAIYTLNCNRYTVRLTNILGVPTPARDEAIEATLSDDGSGVNVGGFFSDAQCRSGTGSVTFNPGETEKTVYYMAGTARTAVLMADGRYHGYPMLGRYRITIATNPDHRTELGINFEDWIDWDYNDSVICLKNSTLWVDGTTIKSFANQTLTFTIQGISACDNAINLKVIDSSGKVTQNVTLQSTKSYPSVNLNFTYGSRLEIAFYAQGSCTFGRWISQHEQRVRVANRCRTSSDEGQLWR